MKIRTIIAVTCIALAFSTAAAVTGAAQTATTQLLAIFVLDSGDTPLTLPVR